MQFIMFPPCTEAASQYVAMEREWDNGVRPVFIFRFCFILPEWPGTIFLPSQNFFFFMFQIMIIPTLEELLCNERTLYKRLVFSLLLLSHYPEAFSEDTEHCAQSSLTPPQASHLQPYCTALCSFDIDCPPSCLALTLLLLWALPWDTFCPLSQSS